MVCNSIKAWSRGFSLAVVMGLGAFFWVTPGLASQRSLLVGINGLKSHRGQVCFSLFNSAQGFPTSATRALSAKCVQARQLADAVKFGHLQTGNYAIAVFHDANGDGTLNRNQLGIPTEGFGFSRNPRIVTGPPKFGDSAVFVAGAGQRINIQLQYLLGG